MSLENPSQEKIQTGIDLVSVEAIETSGLKKQRQCHASARCGNAASEPEKSSSFLSENESFSVLGKQPAGCFFNS